MAKKDPQETPMMKQYNRFKAQYPGALLLFRVGDFYETFGEDAITASKILGITLTKRHNGAASETELAGFPHHALESYLPRLVRAGQRVAICDQVEDPRFAKKLVKRDVTELVTPGVTYHDSVLDFNRNNYLAALCQQKNRFGLAFLDISTGEFLASEGPRETIEKLLHSFEPAEVLFSKAERSTYQEWLGDKFPVFYLEDWFFKPEFGYELLTRHFQTTTLKGFGVEEYPLGIAAAGSILHYLSENRQTNLAHLNSLARLDESRYVWLDQFTIRNLELLFPQQPGGVALVEVLDQTQTPMGARLLRKWMALPLKERARIEERHAIVQKMLNEPELGETVSELLRQCGDLERLISKVASRRIKPRELLQIKKSLGVVGHLQTLLQTHTETTKYAHQLNPCAFLFQKIENELLPEPKALTHEGGLIRDGVNAELDELRHIVRHSKEYLEKARQNAIAETGISSLKISYNKVFGYYLEVTNAHRDKVPKSWIRKQTLTSAERYITEELKVYEDKIVNAEEKIWALEQGLFFELVGHTADFVQPIQQNARVLATLDCLNNFAHLARKYRYVRPQLHEGLRLEIKAGRHPVIERQLPGETPFIPNDLCLDPENEQIIVITGPNMAGKSALLRQVALITLMAQIGCYVPADSAQIGLVDKIFTRVGASDNLARGESTFMVEMMETASIMNNLSPQSLVLMDEIGRGTSTYDGISIAWAILEFLHNHPRARAKTLFATHYHELNELAKDLPRIRNYHVTVREVGGKIVFLRKLEAGGSEHSFGIHVAQMAGMPTDIVGRAQEIMRHLEENRATGPARGAAQDIRRKMNQVPKNTYQLSFFDPPDPGAEKVKQALSQIDLNTLTPIEALMKLNELKRLLEVGQ
ncbi:MAG: DNA mismatch repair protein MutS [Microscillaceae bacterium]